MGHAPYAGSMPTTQGGTPPRRVHPRYASYGRFHANTQEQMIRARVQNGKLIVKIRRPRRRILELRINGSLKNVVFCIQCAHLHEEEAR